MLRQNPALHRVKQRSQFVFCTNYLILLFPFISIHLKSTIYVTATSSLELSSSRSAAYQPYRDKGNGGKTEGHHICLKLGGGGDCSYCHHNSARINTMFVTPSSLSSSSPVLLCRRECWELGGLSAVDLEQRK